jgi:DNA-nicking Smr family endonuclease
MGRKPHESDEAALFLDAVRGAEPLPRRAVRPPAAPPRVAHRPGAAQSPFRAASNPAITVERDGDRIAGRAAGVSGAQLAALASGKCRPEVTLDLHGLTSERAERALSRFVSAAVRDGQRCLLVVPGRGLHSDGGPVLREVVVDVLTGPMARHVSCFVTAMSHDGGPGALYVMLK